jgi:elongation factor 1-alpha
MSEKPHVSLSVVGHVDAGKSTSSSRLIYELGGISERDMQKLQEKAKEVGKESFGFAFFMDNQKEEQERGITINVNTKEFYTDKYHYSIVDCPGHRDYIKNMISGASQTDIALLMVPANRGGFETSIQKGDHKTGVVQGQTRQHARLLKLLGVEQLIVGINKMDDTSVNYSEERFNEIKAEVSSMLEKIGYKLPRVAFIPFSGFKGENLTKKTDKMPWYKGFDVAVSKDKKATGHTILDALNNVVRLPPRKIDEAVRVPVSGVYKIKGVGDVVTGRVEQGAIKPGQTLKFVPSGAVGKAFTVEMHHKSVPQALAGDNVGINVKGLDKENMPRAGDVIVVQGDPHDTTNPRPVAEFTAVIAVQEHPGELHATSEDGKGGFCPNIHIRTGKGPCQLKHINWRSGKETGGNKQKDAKYVKQNDQAEVVFVPRTPMYVESFKTCPGLGRIAVMDSNQLVMLGKVTNVVYKNE